MLTPAVVSTSKVSVSEASSSERMMASWPAVGATHCSKEGEHCWKPVPPHATLMVVSAMPLWPNSVTSAVSLPLSMSPRIETAT